MREAIYTVKVIHDDHQECFIARVNGQVTIEGYGITPGEALSDLAERLDLWHNESEEDDEG